MFKNLKQSIHRIITLTIKEFNSLWVDKRIKRMILFSPVVQLCIFAYATTLDVKNVTMLVYDRDQTQYSRELVSYFNNKRTIKKITFVNNREEMVDLIDTQKAIFVLNIPQNFQADLISGRGTTLQFILDGRRSNSSQVFSSYATAMVAQFQADKIPGTPKISINTRNWFNPTLEYTWYIVISMTGILAMINTLIITSLSLAQEKEFGTFDQTIVSPLQPSEILIGKTIPAIVCSEIAVTTMIILGRVLFKVPIVSPIWIIYIVTTIFLLSMAGVGLFISSMCKTQQQAILGVFAFMVPSLLLSGFISPIESLPNIMRIIATINPVTYYIMIMKGLFLKGMPWYLIVQYSIPLVLIGIVCLWFAGWFFKQRLD